MRVHTPSAGRHHRRFRPDVSLTVMRGRAAAATVLAFALAGCESRVTPSLAPSIPPSPPPSVAATPAASQFPVPTASPNAEPTARPALSLDCMDRVSDRTLVAYVDKGDLWLYDKAVDASRRLTDDGEKNFDESP